MKDDLLEAAARVLERHGADNFTTNHVAGEAGASIGSLYQYFPNKAALLLALHERDAAASWRNLEAMLNEPNRSPRERFIRLIESFFAIQATASDQHRALADARAPIATTPEFLVFERMVVARLESFLRDATAEPSSDFAFLARFAFTVATSVGERLATRPLPENEIERVAKLTAEMLADALKL